MRKMEMMESRQVIVDAICEFLEDTYKPEAVGYFASVFEIYGDLSEDLDFINLIDSFIEVMNIYTPIKEDKIDAFTLAGASLAYLMDTYTIEYTNQLNHFYWDNESIKKDNIIDIVKLFKALIDADYNNELL